MADDKGSGGGNWWSEFSWFFLIMGALFVAWWITGGPNKASREDKFIQENQGLQAGETYDRPVTILGETF